eukprot:SAG25_NODE_948_length_4622_cov_14.307981_5_plen_46_part_00
MRACKILTLERAAKIEVCRNYGLPATKLALAQPMVVIYIDYISAP